MTTLKQNLENQLAAARAVRQPRWALWRELAEFLSPRRFTWLTSETERRNKSLLNASIIDETGTIAARTCATGMMSGITSPTRPWFKLRLHGVSDGDTPQDIAIWLEACENILMTIFAESNFYTSMAIMYHDLVIYGTAPVLIYEDFENVIDCYNPCAGEYYIVNNAKYEPGKMFREFVLTIDQIEKRWPGKGSNVVKEGLKAGGKSLLNQIPISHAIVPNFPGSGVPSKFEWAEFYWETKAEEVHFPLAKGGFNEQPFFAGRWEVNGNDDYGDSVAQDALGSVKQLQQETRRKAQLIDKLVNPPMVGDISMKNNPRSIMPGGMTYVAGSANSAGFKPAFQVPPAVQEIMLDIQQVQERIRQIFFNDLFMMISSLQTVRTATEIDARKEEKLIMLGPVVERLETEALAKAITRTFAIASRGGILPPAPEGIVGEAIKIKFVSMLAEAQKATQTVGLERLLGTVGNMAGAVPEALDKVDFDAAIDTYGTALNVGAKIIRDEEAVAALRQRRAEEQQAMQFGQEALAAATGAKTLSETDVGGGVNALQQIMGG